MVCANICNVHNVIVMPRIGDASCSFEKDKKINEDLDKKRQ